MFVFLVHSSQVGWSVIHNLLGREMGMERGQVKKFGQKVNKICCIRH